MPKLPKDVRQRVKKASSEGGFDPVPTGIYGCEIVDVNTEGEGDAGPYWTWKFKVLEGKQKGKHVWLRTSFAEGMEFRIKQILEATEMEDSSDSEEFVGEKVRLAVRETKISSGPKKGQPSNDVDKVLPFEAADDEEEEDDEEPKKGKKKAAKEEPDEDDEDDEEEETPKKKGKKKAKSDDDEFEF